jgi:hypothetical protein
MNNQPAFPHARAAGDIWSDKGMTLRDYFAAKAMQGYIAAWASHPNFDDGKSAIYSVSASAYRIADAMLKTRET